MDFELSEEQQALREAVRRWAERAHGAEQHRRIAREGGFSPATWQGLAGMGLTALVIPTSEEGMGLGAVEAMVVMEELGRAMVRVPFLEAALMAPLAFAQAPAQVRAEWMPRMAAGAAMVVPALQERGVRHALHPTRMRATRSGKGWRLHGISSQVPCGDHADAFVVIARLGESNDAGLFLIERTHAGVRAHGYPTQDGGRAAEVAFEDCIATAICPPSSTDALLAQMRDTGIAAIAAEAVGAMEALFAMTVAHLDLRRQFGAPLSSFQALRHRIADCHVQLELARSMSCYATLCLDSSGERRRIAAARTKVQLGHSMRFVGQQCIQLHGGIGVTDECAASHYFKRLTCLELMLGDTLHHLGRVADAMNDSADVLG
ncbi:acyl-CoA dehydrogenase family protein [Variovorax sp. Sphag1AA]|uniref:acyl-CoA dehydrogenase family protein n=1 Tax=Variovorax sp. Sphag1AA TaxID=2587027 RepID=UPI00161144F2|nr:acyl-CoA dehydrogenase family protein [Variovorax sp. Sphag1AA]MBB3178731.1 hypothetical protein [Variovorax sp. Sphag1AA]